MKVISAGSNLLSEDHYWRLGAKDFSVNPSMGTAVHTASESFPTISRYLKAFVLIGKIFLKTNVLKNSGISESMNKHDLFHIEL